MKAHSQAYQVFCLRTRCSYSTNTLSIVFLLFSARLATHMSAQRNVEMWVEYRSKAPTEASWARACTAHKIWKTMTLKQCHTSVTEAAGYKRL